MTVYVNENGQRFYLFKSFSETEHLVEYIVYIDDEDGYSDENVTEPRYYKGELVEEKNYKISIHPSLVQLKNECEILRKTKNELSAEVSKIRQERLNLVNQESNYEPLKMISDIISLEKRYLVTISHWAIRLYDTHSKSVQHNNYDDDGDHVDFDDRGYSNMFDFSSIKFTIGYNLSFYGNRDECRVFAEFKRKHNVKVNEWENSCVVFFADTKSEIEEKLIEYYNKGEITRSKLVDFLRSISIPLPASILKEIKDDEEKKKLDDIENMKKNIEKQKTQLELAEQEYNSASKGIAQ